MTLPLRPAEAEGELGRLGGYRVLGVLGEGGMGVVYRAEDPTLGRPVALKVMRGEAAASPAARARFLREARSMAALHHDHVAPVWTVGEDGGNPFIAMPLLRGESLAARLKREGRLPTAEAVRIAAEMAEGLAAAHAEGLVHRDIKPGNVWLEAPNGRVKLLDFGLARPAGADAASEQLTASGAMMGTPAYMAPEQARGQAGPESDLFALGCVLYEMTTGRRPFTGPDFLAVLSSVALDDPDDPVTLCPDLPPSLAALIRSLLAKKLAERPRSAAEVAHRLHALLAPVPAAAARRGGVPWLVAGIGAAVLLGGVAALAAVFVFGGRPAPGTVPAPTQAATRAEPPPPRELPAELLPLTSFPVGKDCDGFALDRTGQRVLAWKADVGGDHSWVQLHEVAGGRVVRRLSRETDRRVRVAALHPDGDLVAVGGYTGRVRIINGRTTTDGFLFVAGSALGKEPRTLELPEGSPVVAVSFDPTGTYLVGWTGGQSQVLVWSVADWSRRTAWKMSTSGVSARLSFSLDGTRLLTGYLGNWQGWEFPAGKEVFAFRDGSGEAAEWSRDGSRFAAHHRNSGDVVVREGATGKEVARYGSRSVGERLLSATFGADGRLWLLRWRDSRLSLDDTKSGRSVRLADATAGAFAFSHAGARLAVSDKATGTARVYDLSPLDAAP
jgi:predicted Ser/Thr protein kinase